MSRAGQGGGHPIGGLDSRLPVARVGTDRSGWMAPSHPVPRPLGSALLQAAPDFDPLADPSVQAVITSAKSAAEEEGYKAGLERAELEREALRAATEGIAEATATATRRDAEMIATLALAVAGGLVGREISGDAEALTVGIEEAISRVGQGADLILKIAPDDRSLIEAATNLELAGATLRDDSSLGRGEFEVESATALVDARTAGRLEGLRAALIELVDQLGEAT